jgi:uncharacterized protein YjeT (DUF2065 family)
VTRDFLAALCLVLVIEGLMLFGAPQLWRAMAEQMKSFSDRDLRVGGGVMVVLGLLLLQWVR